MLISYCKSRAAGDRDLVAEPDSRYMNDSVIVEEGTHDELLTEDGEYAQIWKLQAQAFV